MINNHFVDDSLLSVSVDEESILAFRDCLQCFVRLQGKLLVITR
jgi:hypothetical protein